MISQGRLYILEDATVEHKTPHEWASAVIEAYDAHEADLVLGERNFGGELVESTLRTIRPNISYRTIWASRGKAIRAEPVSSIYAQEGRAFHTSEMPALEDEMCLWEPDARWSPNRIDALVIVGTELVLNQRRRRTRGHVPPQLYERGARVRSRT